MLPEQLRRLVRSLHVLADDPALLGQRAVHLIDDLLRLVLLGRRQLVDERADVARRRLDGGEVVALLVEDALLLGGAQRQVAELEHPERALAGALVGVQIDVQTRREHQKSERAADQREPAQRIGALPLDGVAQPIGELAIAVALARAEQHQRLLSALLAPATISTTSVTTANHGWRS